MTAKELLSLSKNKVRNNKDLLALFKVFFREHFGREPSCTGCTGFKDFDLFKEVYFPTKTRTKMRVTKFKVLYPREKILSYLKDGKVYRSRVSHLTDEFLSEFLKYGNQKVYQGFKRMILPLADISQDVEKEVENDVLSEPVELKTTPKQRKPRAKKARSPKKKKDE